MGVRGQQHRGSQALYVAPTMGSGVPTGGAGCLSTPNAASGLRNSVRRTITTMRNMYAAVSERKGSVHPPHCLFTSDAPVVWCINMEFPKGDNTNSQKILCTKW